MPRVAAAQLMPICLDVEATLEKMDDFAARAAAQGAELVVFPECACSMYPNWVPDIMDPRTGAGFFDYYKRYLAAAVTIPGPATQALEAIARRHRVDIVTGVVERDANHRGVLYNSAVVVSRTGELVGRHRKLTPVNHERLYFAPGGAEDVCVFDTPAGRLGVGICFENRNLLYNRMLGEMGEEIHCALWVCPGPEQGKDDGTLNGRDYVATLAKAYALTVGSFVVTASIVTDVGPAQPVQHSWHHMGCTMIVAPNFRVLAEVPPYEEGIAVADLDLELIGVARLDFNPYGKESRDDLFRLESRTNAPARG